MIGEFPEKGALQTIDPEAPVKTFSEAGLCGWVLTRDSEGRVLPSILMFGEEDAPTVARQLSFTQASELAIWLMDYTRNVAAYDAKFADAESAVELKLYAQGIEELVLDNFVDRQALEKKHFDAGVKAQLDSDVFTRAAATQEARAAGRRDALRELAPTVQKLADAAVTDSEARKESILGEADVQAIIQKAVELA